MFFSENSKFDQICCLINFSLASRFSTQAEDVQTNFRVHFQVFLDKHSGTTKKMLSIETILELEVPEGLRRR